MLIQLLFLCFVCNEGHVIYDYIIVGSGTAGSLLAYKLAERRYSVLVLEAGVDAVEEPNSFPTENWPLVVGNANVSWQLVSTDQPRVSPQQAKMGGGCSSHNSQQWELGNEVDWNNFARKYSAIGWDWNSMRQHASYVSDAIHPLRRKIEGTLADSYRQAARELSIPFRENHNNPDEGQLGLFIVQANVKPVLNDFSLRNGAYQVFLKPCMKKHNCRVLFETQAIRVIFRNKRAIGVEFRHEGRNKVFYAKREVIIAAGAIRTPHLLMHSGIGPAEQLREFGIPIVSNLPGVGQNHQTDHLGLFLYSTSKPAPSDKPYFLNFGVYGRFDGQWDRGVTPDYQIGFIARKEWPLFVSDALCPAQDGERYCIGGISTTLHSQSRGKVELASSDPFENPKIITNYFDPSTNDGDRYLQSFEKAREFMETKAMKDWGVGEEIFPLPGKELTNNIPHEHHLGTARVGPFSDRMAVVDPKFRVHGVTALRVVDSSVIPESLSANPQYAVFMIASKAASDLLENYHNCKDEKELF